MAARGYDANSPTDCLSQIEGFGEYGFPESHAASFANLVYASAWIKCHYPDVFAAALLNSQPMGFYATAQLVRDAQEHGVEVRPVDVNLSNWDCTLEAAIAAPRAHCIRAMPPCGRHATTHALRLGLRQIGGFSEDWGEKIESLRGARLQFRPRSLAAHAAAAEGAGETRACRRLQFARAQPPRCALGGQGAAPRRRQGRPAAVRARRHAGARARCAICRRCRRASR